MNQLDNKNYVDDGSVYIIKNDETDIEKLLEYEIDVKELNKKYKFALKDKDIIINGSLQLQSPEPDIQALKKAIELINHYKSEYLKEQQNHLRHAQHRKEEELSFSSDLDDNVWKTTLLALFFGPIGLLKVSWQLAVGVAVLAGGMFFIFPELLASIPIISALSAWAIVHKKSSAVPYEKHHVKEEIVFKTGEEEEAHLLSDYMQFLKQEKTLWLAAVLAFFFNGFGLFYVSWVFAVGMLVFTISVYMSFPILLVASPFLSLGLALFAAIETNNKRSYMNRSAAQ